MRRLAVLILALSAAASLVACGTGPAVKVPAPGKGKVKAKRLEFKGAKGKLIVEEAAGALPEGFPADLPIFKPARAKSTVASRGTEESTMTMAIFETTAGVGDVAAYYQTNLPAAGWAINNVVTAEQGTTFAVSKESQAGSIAINKDEGRRATIISINLAVR